MVSTAESTQSTQRMDLGKDGAASRPMAAYAAHFTPVAFCSLCRQIPKVGAECEKDARSDLRGGRSEMAVPTVIVLFFATVNSV